MQKLIFIYEFGSEGCGWYNATIPFEYSSKDDFCYEILERIEKSKGVLNSIKGNYRSIYLEVFNYDINITELEDIENMVFTLDEWFEKKKEQLI